MSETVAKGYVLIPAHNLSTNWLPEKKQEQKTPLLPWQIELRHEKVATLLQSWIWAVIFLLLLSTNAQFETKCQSLLSVQIGTDASGDHALP